MRVLGGEAVGVLVHVECADQDGTGGLQPCDRQRIGGCRPGVRAFSLDARTGDRHQPFDVKKIFHRKRHAFEFATR